MAQSNFNLVKTAPKWTEDHFVFSKKETRNRYCHARVYKKGKIVRKANKIAYAEQLNDKVE